MTLRAFLAALSAVEPADATAASVFSGACAVAPNEAGDHTQFVVRCFAITALPDEDQDDLLASATTGLCARGRKGGIYMHAGITGDTTSRELGNLDREVADLVGQYGLGQATAREDFARQTQLSVAYIRQDGAGTAEIYIRLGSGQSIVRSGIDTDTLSVKPAARTAAQRDDDLAFFVGSGETVTSGSVDRGDHNRVTRPIYILMPTALGLAQLGAQYTVSVPTRGAT